MIQLKLPIHYNNKIQELVQYKWRKELLNAQKAQYLRVRTILFQICGAFDL